jgi:hypothetical protein
MRSPKALTSLLIILNFSYVGQLARTAAQRTAANRQSHKVTEFDGWLDEGQTYRAGVRYTTTGELAFIAPMRIMAHHAIRVEWINLNKYADLKEATKQNPRWIVFRVMDKRIVKMAGQNRWNTTYRCRIERTVGAPK